MYLCTSEMHKQRSKLCIQASVISQIENVPISLSLCGLLHGEVFVVLALLMASALVVFGGQGLLSVASSNAVGAVESSMSIG